MSTICPRCGCRYPCDPRDARANQEATACENCVEHPRDWRNAEVIGRLVVVVEPIVLSRCCVCGVNYTAGGASEAGTLACRACLEKLE